MLTRGSGCGACVACGLVGLMIAGAPALADDRAFTFVYESPTLPAGAVEFEQWVTWSTDKGSDSSFDRLDFREELEFGVTDRFQLAFYFDWRYEDGASVDEDGVDWRDVALEAIFRMSDRTTDLLGSALYGEVKVGEELFVLEGKLILDKRIDRFVIAYNAIIEAEWEGEDFDEETGEIGQTLGVSFEVSPTFLVGAEAVHEIELPGWSEREDDELYLGPNISIRPGGWWLTATPLVQVTDNDGAADFVLRVLFGVHF